MTDFQNNIDIKTLETRYQRAQHLMQGIGSNKVAFNSTVFPVWIKESDCFWYVRHSRVGNEPSASYKKEYRLVDARAGTNEKAFDQQALATALAEVAKQEVDADNLPITDIELSLNPTIIHVTAFNKRWRFDAASGSCTEIEKTSNQEVISPDGRYLIFSKEYNLWLRDRETGEEKPLTTDGEQHYAYGGETSAWGLTRGAGPQIAWSPDSRRLFTLQLDRRKVKTLPVVHHVPCDGSTRPKLEQVPVAYPGDDEIETLRLLAIDVETGQHQPADYIQVPATRNGWGFFDSTLGWWGKDSHLAYFVDVDRYYKYARVVEFDTTTGACRRLFEETTDTHINLMLNQDAYPSYMPLPESEEILWFSERTGWAHLYRYDLKTGELKNAVTSGPGLVRNIVKYIPERREVFVQMASREAERDPYYRDLVRVNIDTGEMTTVISSDHEYVVIPEPEDFYKSVAMGSASCPRSSCGVCSNGEFIVTTRSRADETPVSFIVDRNGKKLMDFETADVSALPEGWQWPEPVKLKAADGQTDIYGLVFRPTSFDPEKSYPPNSWPVVSHGFNQPEVAWVPKGSFTNGMLAGWNYLDAAAVAELGFIVVQIDGRGSPEREKAFFDKCYGCFESASHIDDHVEGIKQLAKRYPYMDLNRVGITAHPTGGSGAVQGLLKHPSFFKVGITQMYHDRRFMSAQMQGDKYEGPSVIESELQYPEDYIDRLEGKLLLMIGMLDTCTPPAATFRLVEALQQANKDFDMIVLPKFDHGNSSYLTRRAWDYLVKHLLDVEPPKEFKLS